MVCESATSDCIITLSSIIIAIVTIAVLSITINQNSKQLKNNQKQLFTSNFGFITKDVGTNIAIKDRKLLYNCHKERTKLLREYANRKPDSAIDLLNEAARRIASMYDRIGFLLQQNPDLKDIIIDFHGFVIGRLWIIIEPIQNSLWIKIDKQQAYREFQKIGEECYKNPKFTEDIEEFLIKNQFKKKITSTTKPYVRKDGITVHPNGDEVDKKGTIIKSRRNFSN